MKDCIWLSFSKIVGKGHLICLILSVAATEDVPPAPAPVPADDNIVTADSLLYEWEALKDATKSFSNDNKIGQGGFGSVYKVRA